MIAIDLDTRRQVFAEEIQTCFNIRSDRLVSAIAAVPREQFLEPGPWTIVGEGDYRTGGRPRSTPDGDPRHLYHNVSVALDAARQLFNGPPGVVVSALDALDLAAGARVLHVGCGAGYYTALVAHTVGSSGRVLGLDVDGRLAGQAARQLASLPWVEVRQADGSTVDGPFDAIFVNAGVTHPLDAWLDALAPGGRMVLPLTFGMPQMGSVSKGAMVRIAGRDDGGFDAQVIHPMLSIYSAIGLRDDALNGVLGQAFQRTPFLRLARFRRDAHETGASCWYHTARFCFASA
jgi:protein-L-isoaspartate(D-aspartate) O-methyltransferase